VPINPDIYDSTRKIVCDEVSRQYCNILAHDRLGLLVVYQIDVGEFVTMSKSATEKAVLAEIMPERLKRKGGQRPGEGGRAFVRRTWQGGGRAIGARFKGQSS
jgi:hypothetical protein